MQKNVLVLEDDIIQRSLYVRVLKGEGYTVFEAQNIQEAKLAFKQNLIFVAIIDVGLPDGSGIDYIVELKSKFSYVQIIIFTGNGTVNDVVLAMKNGASDYLVKGESDIRLLGMVSEALRIAAFLFQHDDKKIAVTSFDKIKGISTPIEKLKVLAMKVAKTQASVLILGETGVGKDLFAEAIHQHSKRSKNNFIAINCSALSDGILESELFGYKAGAFTGAIKDKKGLFEEANKGTIFLDEIGEMSLSIQAKILRVLENGSFIKLGDPRTIYTDCRIIAATNVNLLHAIREGKFREDLYYRIASFTIKIPPLRERQNDIIPLAEFYINKIVAKMGIDPPKVTKPFFNALENYSWPGNIRELINVIERSLILTNGTLTPDLLEFQNEKLTRKTVLLEEVELDHIKNVLDSCKGNKRQAAKILGVSIATLYRKLNAKEEE